MLIILKLLIKNVNYNPFRPAFIIQWSSVYVPYCYRLGYYLLSFITLCFIFQILSFPCSSNFVTFYLVLSLIFVFIT